MDTDGHVTDWKLQTFTLCFVICVGSLVEAL